MKQIITKFTDNDLYTFTCQYYILRTYPQARVKYSFFDRNYRKYPKGFDKLLQEQINYMQNVVITEEEVEFMKRNVTFLPLCFYYFLKGYRFNPNEVKIVQDESGYLYITIEGYWYSAIMWEMPILSIISELMHIINGDMENYNGELEYKKAYEKGIKAFTNGLRLSDMGTRRRFSFENQEIVLNALKDAYNHVVSTKEVNGNFIGTSNVWFANKLQLKPIGTMSHQIISFEECVSGVFNCNNEVMRKWADVYNGELGIYLPDCFSSKVFLNNLTKKFAKMYDGIRIDSGDEMEETDNMFLKYQELGVNPSTKSIVYSNALTIDKAIAIHKWLADRMIDSYGIGTHLCADVTNTLTNENFPYSNIVIKLVGMWLNETSDYHDCVKIANGKGKTLGNKDKCDFLLTQIC